MDAIETVEEANPSFFENPLGWLFDKASELGRQRREEAHEWAEHKSSQNIEKFLQENPEIADRAKANADMGLESGTISPAVYEMLQKVETTQNHTPAPDASISTNTKSENLELTR